MWKINPARRAGYITPLLLVPVLLWGADLTILRDSPRNGNNPGLVIAVFAEAPRAALDTVGYRFESGQVVPVTEALLVGLEYCRPDSSGARATRPGEYRVNWNMADTITVTDTLPSRPVIMSERFLAGGFHPVFMDSLAVADSLWRLSR